MEDGPRSLWAILEPRRSFKRRRRNKITRRMPKSSGPLVRRALVNSVQMLTTNACSNSIQDISITQRVCFNVGGVRYEIAKTKLDKYPDTLLGSKRKDMFFDAARQEYFFDRDPIIFKSIVDYYRSGEFHFSTIECWESVREELAFYGVPKECVAECCCEYIDFEKSEKAETEAKRRRCQVQNKAKYPTTGKQRLWQFLTNEKSSRMATAFSLFFGIVVLLNICTIIAETVPAREEKVNKTNSAPCEVQTKSKYWRYGSIHSNFFFGIDSFCVGIFTFEYLAKLFAAPKRWTFVLQFSNALDLIGILPYYISIIENVVRTESRTLDVILTALRIFRVLRITKLARHSSRFQNLMRSIKGAAAELGGILFSFMALMIMLSTVVYHVENNPPQEEATKFKNIPVSIWYCLVTMTTLG